MKKLFILLFFILSLTLFADIPFNLLLQRYYEDQTVLYIVTDATHKDYSYIQGRIISLYPDYIVVRDERLGSLALSIDHIVSIQKIVDEE